MLCALLSLGGHCKGRAPILEGATIFVHFGSLASLLASLRSLYPRFSLLTEKGGKVSASIKVSEKRTTKGASAGGVKKNQYWSESEAVVVSDSNQYWSAT